MHSKYLVTEDRKIADETCSSWTGVAKQKSKEMALKFVLQMYCSQLSVKLAVYSTKNMFNSYELNRSP
jgi:hypothetical protein